MLSYEFLTPVTLLVLGVSGVMFSTVPALFLCVVAERASKEIYFHLPKRKFV